MRFAAALLLLHIACSSLSAEILDVVIRWRPEHCVDNCTRDLHKYLTQIKGMKDLSISLSAGQASFSLKEGSPLTYRSVNTAMRMVGLFVQELRVTARGKVRTVGDKFFFYSDGDSTKFTLVGPIVPAKHQYIVESTETNRPIPENLKEQLLDAKKQGLILIISGPLLMPWRLSALTLIVESIKVEKEKEKK